MAFFRSYSCVFTLKSRLLVLGAQCQPVDQRHKERPPLSSQNKHPAVRAWLHIQTCKKPTCALSENKSSLYIFEMKKNAQVARADCPDLYTSLSLSLVPPLWIICIMKSRVCFIAAAARRHFDITARRYFNLCSVQRDINARMYARQCITRLRDALLSLCVSHLDRKRDTLSARLSFICICAAVTDRPLKWMEFTWKMRRMMN